MNAQPYAVVPHSIDLSSLVRRSVASLYSHLVTRPTGQALRVGIESQIAELGDFCVSVLDFTQVVVLDYSCADEAVAKLVLRYQRSDRPSNAYFIARGVSEHHRDAIEAVLLRHDLTLTADVEGVGYTLLGSAGEAERTAWAAIQKGGPATVVEVARRLDAGVAEVSVALERLAERRAVVKSERPRRYLALSSLLPAR